MTAINASNFLLIIYHVGLRFVNPFIQIYDDDVMSVSVTLNFLNKNPPPTMRPVVKFFDPVLQFLSVQIYTLTTSATDRSEDRFTPGRLQLAGPSMDPLRIAVYGCIFCQYRAAELYIATSKKTSDELGLGATRPPVPAGFR